MKLQSLIAGYLERLAWLTTSPGTYAYRGQANAGWPLKSAAYRRFENNSEEEPTRDDFIEYHEEILESARMDGHGVVDGRDLRDLELLAKLQHLRTATCLIDFSRNFLVALWFACLPHKGKDGTYTNGKVFVVNTNDPVTFLSLEQQDLKKNIQKVLTFKTREQDESSTGRNETSMRKPLYWHWSPHGLNERILKQDSLFIFGPPKIEDTLLQSIKIRQEDKTSLLQELETLGITRRSLFKDLSGYAESHGCNEPLPKFPRTAEDYFRAGNEAYQRGKIDKAIENYNKAIKRKSDYAQAYNNLGVAKANQGKMLDAITDYDQAIKLKPDHANAYYNRAITKTKLERYHAAITDYDRVIELKPDDAEAYISRGRAKTKLTGYHTAAIADFDRAIQLNPDDANAYCCRGIAKAKQGGTNSARSDLIRARQLAEQSGDNELMKIIDEALSYLDGIDKRGK